MLTLLDNVPFVLFLGVIASLIATIMTNWMWPKAKSFNSKYHLDSVSMSFIDRAVSFLPESQREVSREEWYGHLLDIESPAIRLTHAISCIRAAMVISSEVYVLAPVGQVISSQAIKVVTQLKALNMKLFDQLILTGSQNKLTQSFMEVLIGPAKMVIAMYFVIMDKNLDQFSDTPVTLFLKSAFNTGLGLLIIYMTTIIGNIVLDALLVDDLI